MYCDDGQMESPVTLVMFSCDFDIAGKQAVNTKPINSLKQKEKLIFIIIL